MRADRLLAAVLILQARGRVTAAELAAELEVSVRTARRDLEALSAAGVPVYPQRGRDGGWQLVGGYRTDLSGLTADEARALFLVAGPSAASTPEVRAALRKLMRALPEPLRASAEAASVAVLVDPAGWSGHAPPAAPAALDALRDAVIARRQVRLGYETPGKAPSTRVVHPYGLVAKRGVWYLLAGTDDGVRTFRVERATAVEELGDEVVVPEGFDLAEAWAGVLEGAEAWTGRGTPPVVVTVAADESAMPHLRARYPGRLRDVEPGVVALEVVAPWMAVADLAPWVAHVTVLAPQEVRDELLAVGRALVERYG